MEDWDPWVLTSDSQVIFGGVAQGQLSFNRCRKSENGRILYQFLVLTVVIMVQH